MGPGDADLGVEEGGGGGGVASQVPNVALDCNTITKLE